MVRGGSSPLGRIGEAPFAGLFCFSSNYIRPFSLVRDCVATTLATVPPIDDGRAVLAPSEFRMRSRAYETTRGLNG